MVVDLDGTLIKSDLLYESLFLLLRKDFLALFLVPLWLLKGKPYLKQKIADRVTIAAHLLPYNEELLAYLREQKSSGRRIVLATASNIKFAESVAKHLALFDDVIASTDQVNLKSEEKLHAIRDLLGESFGYAGDSSADIPIWKAADSAILVNVSDAVRQQIPSQLLIEKEQQRSAPLGLWFKGLRIHQWVKNSLLFVPLFTSFLFSAENVFSLLLAFISFSFLASATYILNDLTDLNSDRIHRTKKYRPFASGAIPIQQGLLVAIAMILISFLLGAIVGPGFFLVLIAYFGMTLTYSWMLKRYVLMDVIMLSLLYTIRVVAGSAAINVMTTEWLLAFSVFIFLSLALVKRCSELVMLSNEDREAASGRDYNTSDLIVLWPFGVGAAMAAVVVFCQFISDPGTQERYASPILLWLIAPALTYWLMRLWVKTARAEMHDDPIVYAIRDKGSLVTIASILLIAFLAFSVQL